MLQYNILFCGVMNFKVYIQYLELFLIILQLLFTQLFRINFSAPCVRVFEFKCDLITRQDENTKCTLYDYFIFISTATIQAKAVMRIHYIL